MGVRNVAHGTYPKHTRYDKDLKSYYWCFSNGIQVGPVAGWQDDWGKWLIEIRINKDKNMDPARYTYDNVMDKVYEYCDYYYNKYKKDDTNKI
jgi:hypothetical protein